MRSSLEACSNQRGSEVAGAGGVIRKTLLVASLLAAGVSGWSGSSTVSAEGGPEPSLNAPEGGPAEDPKREERQQLERELDAIKRRLMELQGPGSAAGGPHELGLHPPGPHGPEGAHAGGPGGPAHEEHRRQAAEHLTQAIRHLRAIGADQPARRLENALEGLHRGDMRGPDGSPRGDGPGPAQRGPWGQMAEQGMREVHGKLQALRQTVEKLEKRAADSQEVGRAADEAHRKVEKLHRALEVRTEEIERHLDNRTREIEKLLHAHAEKWHHEHQATIEKLHRELDERFGMVKKHLKSLESEHPKGVDHEDEEAARKKKEWKKRQAEKEREKEKERSAEGDKEEEKEDEDEEREEEGEDADEDGDEDADDKEEGEDEGKDE